MLFSNIENTDRRILSSSTILGKDKDRLVGVFNSEERINLKELKVLRLHSSTSINSVATTWILRSSGRRDTVVSYLFHKWLFSSLNKEERIVFLEFPETTRNDMIYSALRASSLGYSMKSIRKVLRSLSLILFGRKAPTHERWSGYRTYTLLIEKEVSHRAVMKVKKYSGWRRHQNDQGSLGPQKEEPFYSEPVIEIDTISIFLETVKQLEENPNSRSLFITINNIRIPL